MDHVAIMNPKWKLIEKILSGEKTIESRWYITRRIPWNRIKKGDTVYFKNSGKPVNVKATVIEVEQFEITDNSEAFALMNRFIDTVLCTNKVSSEILKHIKGKKYTIFIHFNNVKEVAPFNINKKGFGMGAAWITIKDINQIKRDIISF